MTSSRVVPETDIGSAKSRIIELRDVSLWFGEKQVLDGVSLAVDPMERIVIIGQSGAGKTTILRLILGILTPTKGSVYFKQHEISRLRRLCMPCAFEETLRFVPIEIEYVSNRLAATFRKTENIPGDRLGFFLLRRSRAVKNKSCANYFARSLARAV